MNDSPSPLGSTPASQHTSLEALTEAHRSLRTAFHVTLVLLVILTASLSLFFMREIGIARRQISDLTRIVVDYEKDALPRMEEFRSKLQTFVQEHPDFFPIYSKYFGATNAEPPAVSPGRAQPFIDPNGARLPAAPR